MSGAWPDIDGLSSPPWARLCGPPSAFSTPRRQTRRSAARDGSLGPGRSWASVTWEPLRHVRCCPTARGIQPTGGEEIRRMSKLTEKLKAVAAAVASIEKQFG
ncbi:MAG: hypothetical protein EOO72_11255, partial [Myxococcaceae bacterium]